MAKRTSDNPELFRLLFIDLSCPELHNARIVGGDEVQPHTIPYHVSFLIGYPEPQYHHCGGVIMDEVNQRSLLLKINSYE